MISNGVEWDQLWASLAVAIDVHVRAGRRHLLTKNVVRFATVMALAEQGVGADRLAAEQIMPDVGRVDLLLDPPGGAAMEFRFPREASEMNAADTMAFGDLLRDFYRLSRLNVGDAWLAQLVGPAFRRYLGRRAELVWTDSPGETLVLPAGLRDAVPASARERLPEWAKGEVRALCVAATNWDEDLLVVFHLSAKTT